MPQIFHCFPVALTEAGAEMAYLRWTVRGTWLGKLLVSGMRCLAANAGAPTRVVIVVKIAGATGLRNS